MHKSNIKNFTSRITKFPIFILLLGIYPVLFLLDVNTGQTGLSAASVSFAIAMVSSLVISGLCLLVIRQRGRAYLAAILLNLAFFSYGHIFNLLDGKSVGAFLVGRHLVVFPLFALLTGGLLIGLLKRPEPNAARVSSFANVILIGLCFFQVAGIEYYHLPAQLKAENSAASLASSRLKSPKPAPANAAQADDGPDIYYIILDGFAREDVIRETLGVSDYNLPAELQKRGFYIPNCAFSNYGATAISLSSSLNLDYLSALGIADKAVNIEQKDPASLYYPLHQNAVLALLERRGYQFVSFRGFFPLNDFSEADYYFNYMEDAQGFDNLAERSFREVFVRTTLLRLPAELYEGAPQKFAFVPRQLAELIAPEANAFSSRSYQWYQQHLFEFNKLETVPAIPGKKFTYAHFYTTHQPYVFNPDGSLLWPINENNDGYKAAVQYTAQRILEVVDRLIKTSPRPPVIVIQADHGFSALSGLDRYKILNAYYLPDGGAKALYPTITPVNTFRVILNQYAGKDYPLLPDTVMTSVEGQGNFVPVSVQAQCSP